MLLSSSLAQHEYAVILATTLSVIVITFLLVVATGFAANLLFHKLPRVVPIIAAIAVVILSAPMADKIVTEITLSFADELLGDGRLSDESIFLYGIPVVTKHEVIYKADNDIIYYSNETIRRFNKIHESAEAGILNCVDYFALTFGFDDFVELERSLSASNASHSIFRESLAQYRQYTYENCGSKLEYNVYEAIKSDESVRKKMRGLVMSEYLYPNYDEISFGELKLAMIYKFADITGFGFFDTSRILLPTFNEENFRVKQILANFIAGVLVYMLTVSSVFVWVINSIFRRSI